MLWQIFNSGVRQIEAACSAKAGLEQDLRCALTRLVDETCRRAQVESLKSSRYNRAWAGFDCKE
jgi:hypothetical protein